jgi:hypothetical protein
VQFIELQSARKATDKKGSSGSVSEILPTCKEKNDRNLTKTKWCAGKEQHHCQEA